MDAVGGGGIGGDESCDDWLSLVVGPGNVIGVTGAAVGAGEFSFATRPMTMPIAARTSVADTAITVGTSQRARSPGLSP